MAVVAATTAAAVAAAVAAATTTAADADRLLTAKKGLRKQPLTFYQAKLYQKVH